MSQPSQPSQPPQPVPVTEANVAQFLQGVDAFVCDCDGVLWTPQGPIENAMAALRALRACGKKVYFVSNNSTLSILDKLKAEGFPVEEDEIAVPATVIARHLQQAGFTKKAFVFGVEFFKNVLRRSGIHVVPEERTAALVDENISRCVEQIDLDPEVGAVVLDVDVNIRYIDLCSAASILKSRPQCLFLVGATDTLFPLPSEKIAMAPGPFLKLLEDITGRRAEVFGKPSPAMVTDFLQATHRFDLSRTVFVGDALKQDMGMANACGMQKLLVFTGVTRPRDLDSCPAELLPDFVMDSIAAFARLLEAHPGGPQGPQGPQRKD
ncbi:4-nitrophenylphosphatase-like [Thrips palmi]|uniref:4-nitrophenylphosphatase-like n=1 Tax=Thrips palmi TaxID=161013 RepID=A0A6P8ZLD6_THRPL|nr:4-nitrophenylphosphatase-like [Thrips palmi]